MKRHIIKSHRDHCLRAVVIAISSSLITRCTVYLLKSKESLVNPREAKGDGDGDGDGEGFVSPFIFVTAAVESAQFYYKSILASDTKSARVTRRTVARRQTVQEIVFKE